MIALNKVNRKALVLVAVIAFFASACSEEGKNSEQSQNGSSFCNSASQLKRLDAKPIGVLLPSGSTKMQSYASFEEIANAGLTGVSLGWTFYYSAAGELVFDFDGSSDADAKKRWISQMQCSVIEAKQSGLVVAVWGQFQEANNNDEPMGIPESIRANVLDQALQLMPEVAQILEDLQVEYWSPVSELDKYVGAEGHNKYFEKMVELGRSKFNGVIYVQPNILQRDSFFKQNIKPNFGDVDALGISWISYECQDEQLAAADYFTDAAKTEGISQIFISELGGTSYADDGSQPCLEKLINYWNGSEAGVFILDTPQYRSGVATIKGSWQESVLQDLVR